jgi:hypothetical protein
MIRGKVSAGRPRRRMAVVCALAAVIAGVFAANAFAGVSTISNGYVGPDGVFGPGHSISRVYVHDYNGAYRSCESALSLGGSWVYSARCVSDTAVWTDLCGCVGRYGWNGAQFNGYEYMTGHEDW